MLSNSSFREMATFNSRKEASEYVEDVLGEDLEDIIIMPLEESDLEGKHDNGNNLTF